MNDSSLRTVPVAFCTLIQTSTSRFVTFVATHMSCCPGPATYIRLVESCAAEADPASASASTSTNADSPTSTALMRLVMVMAPFTVGDGRSEASHYRAGASPPVPHV